MTGDKDSNENSKYKRNAAITAFFITMLIILYYYSSSILLIINDARNPNFILDMNKVEDNYRDQEGYYDGFNSLMEFKEENYFVPDYKVNVSLSFKEKSFEGIIFSIQFVDEGIVKLDPDTWYFQVVVTNNDQIKAIFPESSFYGYREKWRLSTHRQGYYKNTLLIKQRGTEYYIPQDTLKKGIGKYVYVDSRGYLQWSKDYQIFYKFIPDEIGEWNIYVLVFDDKYKDRKGKEINRDNMEEFEDNAVAIEDFIIQFQEKGAKTLPRKGLILEIFGFIGIFVFFYELLERKQKFFVRLYDILLSNKDALLLLIAILILIAFLNYFIY